MSKKPTAAEIEESVRNVRANQPADVDIFSQQATDKAWAALTEKQKRVVLEPYDEDLEERAERLAEDFGLPVSTLIQCLMTAPYTGDDENN